MSSHISLIHGEAILLPGASAHEEHFFWSPRVYVYDYNSADDGPECEIITRILAHHHALNLKLPSWLGKADA